MIKLQPLHGRERFPSGAGYRNEQVDTGIDAILFEGHCVGYIKRQPGAHICLTRKVSAATEAEIRRSADFRDRAMVWGNNIDSVLANRKTARAPVVPEGLLDDER